MAAVLQKTPAGVRIEVTSKKLHLSFYHIPNSAPVAQSERVTAEDRKPL